MPELNAAGDNDAADDIFRNGPGQLFLHYNEMEELLDNLKLLNYDQEFVKDLKQKSLSQHYFAIATNPGEQFYNFASLAAWLVRKCGKSFVQPQEYDDPNSTITSILDVVRDIGVAVDFPPNRLKQGVGEHAVFILVSLANYALETKKLHWIRAEPKESNSDSVEEIEDEAELLLEKVEEELMAEISDDADDEDEENVLNLEDLRNIQIQRSLLQQQRPDDVLKSNVRLAEWQVELERVLPQLRVTVRADARDWRSHLEQMQKHRDAMQESLSLTKTQLKKIENDIVSALDKIDNREKHLNTHLESLLSEYRSLQDEFSNVSAQYKSVSSGVSERTKTLAKISEEVEDVKKDMEERSSSMTDGAPLINIKKAVTKIKAEMREMDIRIGVLDSEILQARLRRKTKQHVDALSPAVYV